MYMPNVMSQGLHMYMSILGKPTDQDLVQYPHILLTSPHEWDHSVLDYSHPNTCGCPSCSPEPSAMTPEYMNVAISTIESFILYPP